LNCRFEKTFWLYVMTSVCS